MSESTAAPEASKLSVLTTQIVSAYVAGNKVASDALPGLIEQVHRALASAASAGAAPVAEKQQPAVPARKSVFADYIICLEDGLKLKMLKRHLQNTYGLTPQQYREKWGLPSDYPMVAPAYASRRSELAKQIGLGRKPAGDGAVKVSKLPARKAKGAKG